mgnify:FL=1
MIKAAPDTRSKNQKAISQGLKFAWKRKRAAGGWHAKTPEATEAQLHRAVAEFLAATIKPPVVWTTIGHGGGGRVRGAQLKAMGVQKGWPDILILAPGPSVLGIELKRPGKGGSQSPEQRIVEKAFHGCRAWYVLCRSVEEVQRALDFVRVPTAAILIQERP